MTRPKETFYSSIVSHPTWKAWVEYNERHPKFDVHESMELGWMSPEHCDAFLRFASSQFQLCDALNKLRI